MKILRGGWSFKKRDSRGKPTREPGKRLMGRFLYVSADLKWTGPGHGPFGGTALGMDYEGTWLVQKGEPARRVYVEGELQYIPESLYRKHIQENENV